MGIEGSMQENNIDKAREMAEAQDKEVNFFRSFDDMEDDVKQFYGENQAEIAGYRFDIRERMKTMSDEELKEEFMATFEKGNETAKQVEEWRKVAPNQNGITEQAFSLDIGNVKNWIEASEVAKEADRRGLRDNRGRFKI